MWAGGGGGGEVAGRPGCVERTAIYCPSYLRSAKGLGGASAVVEMWLAIKEKSGAGYTRVAGGAG